MDLNKYSSYLSLPPSNLYRAERLVESVIKYHLNHEDMVDEIVENLTGETLEYALKLFVDKTGADLNEALEYMGVKVAFNGTTYSAPTVGLYGIKSKPEIKSKIKAKVLARNEKENKSKIKKEEYTVTNADKKGNTPAYQAYKAGKKNVKTGKPLYKAADHMKEEAAKRLGKTVQEMDDLCDYFVEHDIAISSNDLNEVMQTIDPEHTEYFLEKLQDLKGKKKGGVIINPKTVEDANEGYGMPNAEAAKKEAKLKRKEMIKVAAKKVGAMKTEGSMKQARKNVGADTCWDGYKAKGTKKKNGRVVPNCVKEDEVAEGYKDKKKKKGHDCASKVKHEEYGVGNCIKEEHTLDENNNVTHYDVMFGHGLERDVPVEDLQILVREYHEHVIPDEKMLDEGERGLWDNIHAKRKRMKRGSGEKKAKPGDKDYPKTLNIEHHQKDKDGNTIPHEDEEVTEALTPQDKTTLQTQKKFAMKKQQMDRQKMAAKKAGKLNVNAESYDQNTTASVDYSGSPSSTPPESAKAKRYPTFADIRAKLAKAGDPSRGIPAECDTPQTSPEGPVVNTESEIEEGKKMAKKDYDGDGKIESGTDEYMGSRDKAIKKAMAKKKGG